MLLIYTGKQSEVIMGRPRGSSKYLKEIQIGQKFGNWTVYDFVISKGEGKTKIAVKCECGNKSHVPAYDLVKGRSTQCKECSSGKSPTISSFSNRTQKSALGRGLTYTIDSAYLSESFSTQGYRCALTQEPITPTNAMAVQISNNAGGLTPDNTVLVSQTVGAVIQRAGIDAMSFYTMAQSVTQTEQSGTGNPIKNFLNRREKE